MARMTPEQQLALIDLNQKCTDKLALMKDQIDNLEIAHIESKKISDRSNNEYLDAIKKRAQESPFDPNFTRKMGVHKVAVEKQAREINELLQLAKKIELLKIERLKIETLQAEIAPSLAEVLKKQKEAKAACVAVAHSDTSIDSKVREISEIDEELLEAFVSDAPAADAPAADAPDDDADAAPADDYADIEIDDALILGGIENKTTLLEEVGKRFDGIHSSTISLSPSNTGFIRPSADSPIKKSLKRDVNDRAAEVDLAIKKIGLVTTTSGGYVSLSQVGTTTGEPSEPVIYQHVCLKPKDIIQTVGRLEGTGFLYLETDSKNTVTSRSKAEEAPSKTEKEEDARLANMRTIAFEHAKEMLDRYDEKKGGAIVIQASRDHHIQAEMTHAALLVLSQYTHPNLKIRNDVPGAKPPDPVRLYGNNNKDYIDSRLLNNDRGFTSGWLKEEQKKYTERFRMMKMSKAGLEGIKPDEGTEIDITQFKP